VLGKGLGTETDLIQESNVAPEAKRPGEKKEPPVKGK